MDKSNNALAMSLKDTDQTSANQHIGKQKALFSSTAYTGDQWEKNMLEACKRLNSDEAYRKEVAKRQF